MGSRVSSLLVTIEFGHGSIMQFMCFLEDADFVVCAYCRMGSRASSLHFQIEFDHGGVIGLWEPRRGRNFVTSMLHLVTLGAGHVVYLLPPLLLRVILSPARPVFKSSCFDIFPDPGALNSCMHTFAENNVGLIMV